ncbi:hypothetical protein LJC31_04350 [Synergistaceae bacterium OttesenSCG-928-I11]|nr:hypothetical protein [Synergistaceae bacterium OttesenSCG-928-I11]
MLTMKRNDDGKGNYRIIRSLHGQGDASFFTPCEQYPDDDMALLDALYGKLLTRLTLMRDICVKVIDLPMTNKERNECQEKVERLIEDIDQLALSIEGVRRGEGAAYTAILREVEIVDESILATVNKIDAVESDGKTLRRRSPEKNKLAFDPKFNAWMKSLLGD